LELQNSIDRIGLGAAEIRLRNVDIGPDVRIDEARLEAENVGIDAMSPGIEADEVRLRAVISEQSLNRAVAAHVPADLALKSVRVSILTGRLRIEGRLAKIARIPVSFEGRPEIENGNRVRLALQDMRGAGISLPGAVRDLIAQFSHIEIDLSRLPVPVWIDGIACEPGRITLTGRARIHWPSAELPSSARAAVESPAPGAALPPEASGRLEPGPE
jgi:hypothetical protein